MSRALTSHQRLCTPLHLESPVPSAKHLPCLRGLAGIASSFLVLSQPYSTIACVPRSLCTLHIYRIRPLDGCAGLPLPQEEERAV